MIVTSKHTIKPDVEQLGGKGANLLRLKQAGYNVPEFIIIPVSSFSLTDDIISLLPEITGFLKTNGLFAVRSSATMEDSIAFSFAGQFKTLLNVPATGLKDAITEVYLSANSNAVKTYLQHTGRATVEMAVIVQQMVPATVAGVGFGINPLTGNKGEKVINIIQGLGEALVNGSATGDSYTITGNEIIENSVAASALLGNEQLLKIAGVLDTLEQVFDAPQDIEFAFAGEQLYLLQSRPVTTNTTAGKIIWDNSNIIESYPGLTLPLTFSFIEKMYGAVYRQLSMVLGISKTKVQRYNTVYDNMLGLLNGRVYYNLNSWYKVLSLLPGYNINAEFMEKMMGVKEKPDIDVTGDKTNKGGIRDYADILKAISHILYNAATVRKQKKIFISHFDAIYNQFRNKRYETASLQEIWADYVAFETLMSSRWKAPLVNDFFAMIYFGVLQKLCNKYAPDQPDIHNQLVASSKDIITTEPLRLLPELAQQLAADAHLKQAFITESPACIWQFLQDPAYRKQLAAVNAYLEKWGERCVAELKLETVSYVQDPTLLISVLKTYITNNITYIPQNNDTRQQAGELMAQALKGKGIGKHIFNHVLKQARYLVSNRENLRYYRTKGFGMVRRIMLALGKAMQHEGYIDNIRDIFYLKLNELELTVNRQLNATAVKDIISGRKEDYQLYEKLPLPERIVTYGKQELILASTENNTGTQQCAQLQGIPCSAGVVRARICKVVQATDAFPQQQIMATYATDPGYVVMFPAAVGILTERGSLLSHAAIVSREMGIPCIVGITGLMEQLNDGDEVLMDGSTGIIQLTSKHNAA